VKISIGFLDPDDLELFRRNRARLDAISEKPDGYTAREIEEAYYTAYILGGMFFEKYVPPEYRSGTLTINAASGHIAVEEG
jgi:hypothetical protein